jgi:capsular polysaccharide biosynthesis protein
MKKVILILLCVLLLFGLAFSTITLLPQFKNLFQINPSYQSETEKFVCKDDIGSPINSKILRNKIVTQWQGSVSGNVISKTDRSFVVEDTEGNQITLYLNTSDGGKWNTVFMLKDSETNQSKKVNFDSLLEGDKILGEFWIFEGGSDHPVAGVISISR